jgi:hypothetical protein
MVTVRVVTDLAECQNLWRRFVPTRLLTDLWEVRQCFHRHFRRPVRFLVAEDGREARGLLPLSWIEEAGCYGYFPGETWARETWLEQNRIAASGQEVLQALLANCPGPYHIRYLLPFECVPQHLGEGDEVGYLFLPPDYGYDIENYFQAFSNRSAKRLKRELAEIEDRADYRYDEFDDLEAMAQLNIGRFGEASYFADARFRDGFRSLAGLLRERGWLRVTTVLVNGQPVAVDMGCVYQGAYTLLAGGTCASCPGVAKVVNVHHMRRACDWRVDQVDFLCGDFSWKKLFHLTERPLYLISNWPVSRRRPQGAGVAEAAHAG